MKYDCDGCGARQFGWPTFIKNDKTFCEDCYKKGEISLTDLFLGLGTALLIDFNVIPLNVLPSWLLLFLQLFVWTMALAVVFNKLWNIGREV